MHMSTATFVHAPEYLALIEEKPVSLAALVASSTAPVKRKKGETPAIIMRDISELTDAFPGYVAALKDAEARKLACNAAICAAVEPRRIQLARQFGEPLSSVNVNGLLYIYSKPHHTTALKPERVPEVMDLFGGDFQRYFTAKVEVTATPDALSALAAAGIPYTVKAVPTEALHIDRTLRPNVAAKCEAGLPDVCPIAYVRVK